MCNLFRDRSAPIRKKECKENKHVEDVVEEMIPSESVLQYTGPGNVKHRMDPVEIVLMPQHVFDAMVMDRENIDPGTRFEGQYSK